ncbi:MAG: 2Fe-2S iron-sulfur cluster binding domain-containing protein, partial [Firmicutes bacterium]|nr:2Fe-2S iron-sulfur cluster binding domain-containing protein [Bacillota bacterium]
MAEINVKGYGIISAEDGEGLYRILSAEGLIEGPCGGSGRCGKCRIRVLSDCPNCPEEAAFFTKKELEDGM